MPKTVPLHLPRDVASVLQRLLAAALSDADSITADGVPLADDDPRWDRHSGGAGHSGREWSAGDLAPAVEFYAYLRKKAKVFLDLLIDHPGIALDVDDLCRLAPGTFTGSSSVAGAINGLRKPKEASERRYPFVWWEGSPTEYAMKPAVAGLFRMARTQCQQG